MCFLALLASVLCQLLGQVTQVHFSLNYNEQNTISFLMGFPSSVMVVQKLMIFHNRIRADRVSRLYDGVFLTPSVT